MAFVNLLISAGTIITSEEVCFRADVGISGVDIGVHLKRVRNCVENIEGFRVDMSKAGDHICFLNGSGTPSTLIFSLNYVVRLDALLGIKVAFNARVPVFIGVVWNSRSSNYDI